MTFTPSDKQLEAVDMCLDRSKRIVAVTGPAGSGKTTIIRLMCEALDKEGVSYALAAPTGKAAKRIKEATGINAVTIHKLLQYNRPGERDDKTGKALSDSSPKRDASNPLSERVIIVDEYTMVTHELNRNIIDALSRGAVLRVFGDIFQLPPIEPHRLAVSTNSPFEEHLGRSGSVVTLETVYRQAADSGVLAAAERIRKGVMPQRSDDFCLVMTDQPVKKIQDWVLEQQDNGVDYSSIRNQILTPTRIRWIGTYELNLVLRNVFNPNPISWQELPRHKWEKDNKVVVGVGDKVVCTENTYDMRDYETRYAQWDSEGFPIIHSFIPTPDNKMMLNGETGVVLDIYPDGGMEIDFGDRIVEVPKTYEEYWAEKAIIIDRQPGMGIDLAYALTTHKAQGSEYDEIAYVMNKSIFFMLTRENLYTAVTRAKKRATLITDGSALSTALRMNEAKRKAAKEATEKKKMIR